MNIPETWNYNLKKVKGANPNGKKWICQLVIAESKTFNTKSVSDPDEALVQYGMILLLDIFNILIVRYSQSQTLSRSRQTVTTHCSTFDLSVGVGGISNYS
jgi:hypothetical protein